MTRGITLIVRQGEIMIALTVVCSKIAAEGQIEFCYYSSDGGFLWVIRFLQKVSFKPQRSHQSN